MKSEVGMYVRYKYEEIVYIGKITFISEVMCGLNETLLIDIDNCMEAILLRNIIKASHNIIDLIEEGDFINGFEVMEADWINDDLEYEEGLAIPLYSSDDLEVIENWQPLKYMKIKSIVTREQFERMSYKVVE